MFDDEDEQTITVGAIVTVVVNLTRKNLQVLFEKENQSDQTTNEELLNESNQEDGLIVEEVEQQQKPVVVNKQVAKSKNNNKKNKNSKQPQPQQTKQIKETESNEDDEEEDSAAEDIETIGNSSIESKSKSKPTKTSNNNEEYFEKFQQLQKKREKLEAKTKISHRVYCPYYSDVKQECWWLYVADRKNHSIICPPTYICSLKTNEELELRFLAPKTPGTYTYSVILRSDSYLDFDVSQNIKLDVEKAKDIEEHPQWDFSDEEANKSDNEKDDEFETESDSD